MARYPRCKTCGRPITFIETPAGNKMPCDTRVVFYIPCTDGKEKLVTGSGTVVRGVICEKATRDTVAGLMPHWATCPGAKQHKKKRAAQSGAAKGEGLQTALY